MSACGFFEPETPVVVAKTEISTIDVERKKSEILERFPINPVVERVCAVEEDAARRCAGGRDVGEWRDADESLIKCKDEVDVFLKCARENLFMRLGRE